jgi:hypothetical protein
MVLVPLMEMVQVPLPEKVLGSSWPRRRCWFNWYRVRTSVLEKVLEVLKKVLEVLGNILEMLWRRFWKYWRRFWKYQKKYWKGCLIK